MNDALAADYLLLAVQGPQGLALAALGKDQVTVTAQPTIDSTKPMASVDIDGVEIGADDLLPMSDEQLAYLTDCGGVATTAEMVGAVLRFSPDQRLREGTHSVRRPLVNTKA